MSLQETPDPVKNACEANFDARSGDCSGFAKAVAGQLDVTLTGQADNIIDTIRGGPHWTRLADGVAAAAAAAAGEFVIGGLKGSELVSPQENGHVVVVVAGPLNRERYPSAYWGRLHGVGKKDETVNWAWEAQDRDHVTYAAHGIQMPAASIA